MILLDTCVFIWQILDPSCLSEAVKSALYEHNDSAFISNMTAFELARLVKKKKITLSHDARSWFYCGLERLRIREIPISSELMFLAEELPDIHHDPIDRLIIATAKAYDLSILTPDRWISQYPGIKTIW